MNTHLCPSYTGPGKGSCKHTDCMSPAGVKNKTSSIDGGDNFLKNPIVPQNESVMVCIKIRRS